jgi:hypothetical protein
MKKRSDKRGEEEKKNYSAEGGRGGIEKEGMYTSQMRERGKTRGGGKRRDKRGEVLPPPRTQRTHPQKESEQRGKKGAILYFPFFFFAAYHNFSFRGRILNRFFLFASFYVCSRWKREKKREKGAGEERKKEWTSP